MRAGIDDVWLRTSGDRLVTRGGRAVLLRGVNVGGWMNMENFITGFPATESLQREALSRALGEDGARRFFDRFLDVFWADADAAFLASLGVNLVRLPVSYRHFEDDAQPFELILVHAAPDSPYLTRIRPVLDKKARLGVDAWGSLDTGVRHILDPIEETFRREFPDFDPFPFGQRSWIHTLVRHILLAEPMAEDFARCFNGLSGDQAAALAESFAFERCVRRERLCEILRQAAAPTERGRATAAK